MDNVIEFQAREKIVQEASEWIVSFEGEIEIPPEAVAAMNAWMQRSPVHREVLLKMLLMWDGMEVMSALVSPAEDVSSHRRWLARRALVWLASPFLLLSSTIDWFVRNTRQQAQGNIPALASVSVIGLALVLSWWLYAERGFFNSNMYVTAVGESVTHTLDDGSVLWVNTNSKVEVDYRAHSRRIILHRGEAFFQVMHGPNRPFEVYAGARMVRAVGTAFSVSFIEDDIKILVSEGKVDHGRVLMPPQEDGPSAVGGQESSVEVMGSLTVGQSITVPGRDQSVIAELILHEQKEVDHKLAWLKGKLIFSGDTLERVVKEVGRYTSMEIVIVDPNIKTMEIGGQFRVGEVEALFDVLESGFGLDVTRVNERLVHINAK